MKRVQVLVDIPDGYELACDMLRVPVEGELFVGNGDCVVMAHGDHAIPRVIIRQAWKWPSWLKCRWVARNANGLLALGFGDAVRDDSFCFWFSNLGANKYWIVAEPTLDINLPASDWQKSLRINPNVEAKS